MIIPTGWYASNALEVRHSTSNQEVYGIVNNQVARAGVLIQDNYTQILTTVLPAGSLSNYYANQGATNGNGVNQARIATPSPGYLAAIMDSVRLQSVPAARSQRYLHEIASYHADAQQLPALETWWVTLAAPNAVAYRTVGRYLLQAYDEQSNTAAAQRVVAGLQPAALLNSELAAQLKLRAVMRHLPQTMPRLVAADSTVLRTLAWSGTSTAASAGRWLRYFHPRIPLPSPVASPRLAAAHKFALMESGVTLGAAYPNPAQAEVSISCKLAQAEQVAELRFTNLLTGQLTLVVPVAGTGTERSQRVALGGLPAGQYAYQLVVNGQLVAAPKKLIVTL